MSNLDMLEKQHEEVLILIHNINQLASKGLEDNVKEIAFQINALSGKLKMHLMSEDKFLYPSLTQSSNSTIRNTANAFQKEMGSLAELFLVFSQKYNIAMKITENKESFLSESKQIFQKIESRMKKEDIHLYPLLK